MTMHADSVQSVPNAILCSDAKNLHDRILTEIELAKNLGQEFGRTEIAIQRMIMGSYNVVGIPQAFSFGEDLSMREWQVTVTFRDGQTVMLTHHS